MEPTGPGERDLKGFPRIIELEVELEGIFKVITLSLFILRTGRVGAGQVNDLPWVTHWLDARGSI